MFRYDLIRRAATKLKSFIFLSDSNSNYKQRLVVCVLFI